MSIYTQESAYYEFKEINGDNENDHMFLHSFEDGSLRSENDGDITKSIESDYDGHILQTLVGNSDGSEDFVIIRDNGIKDEVEIPYDIGMSF